MSGCVKTVEKEEGRNYMALIEQQPFTAQEGLISKHKNVCLNMIQELPRLPLISSKRA